MSLVASLVVTSVSALLFISSFLYKNTSLGKQGMSTVDGIKNFQTHFGDFLISFLNIFSIYLLTDTVISIAYWTLFAPVYMMLSTLLGPTGLFILWAHSLLQINLLTITVVRSITTKYIINTIPVSQNLALSDNNKNNNILKWSQTVQVLPMTLLGLSWKLLVITALLVLSSIPVLGQISVQLAISPSIARYDVEDILTHNGTTEYDKGKLLGEKHLPISELGSTYITWELLPFASIVIYFFNICLMMLWNCKNSLSKYQTYKKIRYKSNCTKKIKHYYNKNYRKNLHKSFINL